MTKELRRYFLPTMERQEAKKIIKDELDELFGEYRSDRDIETAGKTFGPQRGIEEHWWQEYIDSNEELFCCWCGKEMDKRYIYCSQKCENKGEADMIENP